MSENEMELGERQLILNRPGKGEMDLRAWDAADPQLIDAADTLCEGTPGPVRLAILDDGFGALTLGLSDHKPVSIVDSALARQAIAANAVVNGLEIGKVCDWSTAPDGPFDIIVMKIPRQADYLEYMLRWANSQLKPSGRLVAGGMIKHLPDRCAAVFAKLMASNEPQRAQRKARVILAEPGPATLDDWPALRLGYTLPDKSWSIDALPAVFSRDRLDVGARAFLPDVLRVIQGLPESSRVLDLGCGNGVLGLSVLEARPDMSVTFSDVSSQAVASAKANCQRLYPDAQVSFAHADGVPEDTGYDVILCNPPFHEGGAVGDHIAMRLFRQSAGALKRGGRLLVVGNRHLGYHVKLKRFFDGVEQLVASPKFVVFACTQRH